MLIPPDVVHSFDDAGDEDAGDAATPFGNFHAPACGFGDNLRGRNPGFDQHEQPPGGGLDPASVVACRLGA